MSRIHHSLGKTFNKEFQSVTSVLGSHSNVIIFSISSADISKVTFIKKALDKRHGDMPLMSSSVPILQKSFPIWFHFVPEVRLFCHPNKHIHSFSFHSFFSYIHHQSTSLLFVTDFNKRFRVCCVWSSVSCIAIHSNYRKMKGIRSFSFTCRTILIYFLLWEN